MCVGMTCWRGGASQRKGRKNTCTPGREDCWRMWLACVRVESWHADVDPHKEGKEKNTYLGVDDGRVRACRCIACGCRLV